MERCYKKKKKKKKKKLRLKKRKKLKISYLKKKIKRRKKLKLHGCNYLQGLLLEVEPPVDVLDDNHHEGLPGHHQAHPVYHLPEQNVGLLPVVVPYYLLHVNLKFFILLNTKTWI